MQRAALDDESSELDSDRDDASSRGEAGPIDMDQDTKKQDESEKKTKKPSNSGASYRLGGATGSSSSDDDGGEAQARRNVGIHTLRVHGAGQLLPANSLGWPAGG